MNVNIQIPWENLIFATIGAVTLLVIWLKAQKDKKDTGESKMKWKKYWETHWDDYGFALFAAWIVAVFSEDLWVIYHNLTEDEFVKDDILETYNRYLEIINFGAGLFGTVIIKVIYRKKEKLENL